MTSGRTQSRFPQLGGVYLRECATHAIFDGVVAPCGVAEARLAPLLLRSITAEMLVLLDRGLFAGPLLEAIREIGAHVVAGLESHVLTHPCQRLSDGSYLAWLSPQASHGLHKPLLLRVISYRIYPPDFPCHGHPRRLVPPFLDPKQAPAQALIDLYHERWEV